MQQKGRRTNRYYTLVFRQYPILSWSYDPFQNQKSYFHFPLIQLTQFCIDLLCFCAVNLISCVCMFLLQIQQCQKFVLISVRHCVSLMEKDSMKMKPVEQKEVELKKIKCYKNRGLNWNVVAHNLKVFPSIFLFSKPLGTLVERWTHSLLYLCPRLIWNLCGSGQLSPFTRSTKYLRFACYDGTVWSHREVVEWQRGLTETVQKPDM